VRHCLTRLHREPLSATLPFISCNRACCPRFLVPQSWAEIWHCRLGHTNTKKLRLLGYNGFDTAQCAVCIQAKQICKAFCERAITTLFHMYSDLCGLVNPSTHDGMQYFLTFIDEAPHVCWIYLLHDKSSSTVIAVLQAWLPFVQNQARSTLKQLSTDRGREYLGLENVTRFFSRRGIVHEQTAAHSSASNGADEQDAL
jgi:hypothetical protein